MKPRLSSYFLLFFLACGCHLQTGGDKKVTGEEEIAQRNQELIQSISFSPAAAKKIADEIRNKNRSYLRLSVLPDGGGNYRYDLKIDNFPLSETDLVDTSEDFRFVTDTKSITFLEGTKIDWVNRGDGTSGFVFDNPNSISNELR